MILKKIVNLEINENAEAIIDWINNQIEHIVSYSMSKKNKLI